MITKLIEEFVVHLRAQRYSEKSIKTYRSHLCYFLNLFYEYEPENLTSKQLEDFIIWLIEKKKIGESYQKAIIGVITKFYKELLQKDIDLKHLYPQKKEIKLPNFLMREEVKKLLEVTENLKHRTILTTIYSCGLHLREVLNVRLTDIKIKEKIILIKEIRYKKERTITLSDKLLNLLKEYKIIYRPAIYLFEGQNGEKYSERSVQQIFQNSLEKTGITSIATVCTLRHSYAIHLLENGIDIKTIQELLGHRNITTTKIYLQIMDTFKEKVRSPLDLL
ncbi:site-specific recombinase XerD [Chryseobacterium defluvii]|uniref:Site-specific recombinase XerD n=1 Tax=Chryseobacterium defluvii TaxID=160396 RepID=A0A840KH40_9FLAO|nr:tyrosine-type recombinase/integrase [Chryseobacterium defluvii]MBB4807014.1 site-specific recombinase XerD [Chryseobacterium defluvii]